MRNACLEAWLSALLAIGAWAQTQIDLRTQGKNVDFSGAVSTRPVRTGTQLPPTCAVGEMFFKTDAPPGQNLYACTQGQPNTWTLQSGAGGLPAMAGQSGKVISTDGTAATWRALGGDVSGPPEALTVAGLRGRSVAATAPAAGQVLHWNAGSNQWEPFPAPAAGAVNYTYPFTNQQTVTIPGSAHGLGTAALLVDCYDLASPQHRVEPDLLTVDQVTFDVTVHFAALQSGRCVLNGSGAGGFEARTTSSNSFAAGTVQTFQGALVATGADRTAPAKAGTTLPPACTPGDQYFKTDAIAGQNLYLCTGLNSWTQISGGAGGAVASVFGRTGTVGAQTGDYSFSQIAGTLSDSQLAPGIDAHKIGAGAVSNAALGYLANANADIQAQLDAKASATHSHTAGGDAAGAIDNLTVTKLQARPVSSTAPGDGQALVWSAAGNAWQPTSLVGGGGAAMASQLGDLAVARSSATALIIGGSCSAGTPCNARFGNRVYSFTRSCTATLTGGSGTAYVYVGADGSLTIGHNLSLTASAGCLAQPNVTNFPADAIPIYTWTATSGAWDMGGGRDLRAWLSLKNLLRGSGISLTDSGGVTTVAVQQEVVAFYQTGTATINFPLIPAGQCAADQSFTLLGAATGDAVVPGWPTTLEPGLIGLMRVSAADTLAVRLCNLSGTVIDPAGATFRATVLKIPQ